MKNGPARFDFYLSQLEKLLLEAAKQENPALWLYQNNARTPLFMLEGLAKLYSGIHNPKKFEKIETHFKTLEDALGAIDYYDAFAKEMILDPEISAATIKFLQARTVEKTAFMNDLLTERKWIGENASRPQKIREKLGEADWLDEKSEITEIEKFYVANIGKIKKFAGQYRKGFTELESQVHEIRRKLRWLSIYPQALQGCLQLTENSVKDKNLEKYLTPEIVNSPFNKMPAVGANKYVLVFERDYFLALSWMIAALGKLKDEGLREYVLEEAGSAGASKSAQTAPILAKATEIAGRFFDEKILDKLIKGIEKRKRI